MKTYQEAVQYLADTINGFRKCKKMTEGQTFLKERHAETVECLAVLSRTPIDNCPAAITITGKSAISMFAIAISEETLTFQGRMGVPFTISEDDGAKLMAGLAARQRERDTHN